MASPYPRARRLDLVEELHGHRVADPYRWLEDPDLPETIAWAKSQDEIARPLLEGLAGRQRLQERLRELSAGFVGAPVMRGERAFLMRRAPDQEHAVLVLLEPGEDRTTGGRVLIDPSTLSPDDTVTLDGWKASVEGDLLAYQLSEAGDEESVLRVMDVATGEVVDGPIDRCRYSPVAWLPGGGAFYYVRRLPPEAVPEGEEQFHRRVYLHRVGQDPSTDELVFGEGRDKTAYYGVDVSLDGRWLVVSERLGTAPRTDVWIADRFAEGEGQHEGEGEGVAVGGGLRVVQEGVDAWTSIRVERDGRLYAFTNLDAPRFRLAVADPARPRPEDWTDLLPQQDAVLEGWCLAGDAVVAVRTRHAVSEVTIHDPGTGEARTQVALPGLGVAGITSRRGGGDDLWVSYEDFATPPQVWHYRVSTGELSLWATAPRTVDTPGIRTEQVTYTSNDGTQVRMFLVHRDDVEPDGSRPTILYGYGGFQISLTPGYSPRMLAWVERGGVWAVANLRGGLEEGEAWHRAGMREHKQNVFDDFIAAGEWLVASGWTSPEHLGLFGGSNGGLLVGAALTQRPDLAAAVVCSAPLLDMIRYERFGLGRTWNDEYGSADDPVEFGWLLAYSPYHRVVEGAAYPAVLFTVFDNDTRVDPLHARKLCAALQAATSRTFAQAPILYRREEKVGHAGRSLTRTIELSAEILAFFADRLGLPVG